MQLKPPLIASTFARYPPYAPRRAVENIKNALDHEVAAAASFSQRPGTHVYAPALWPEYLTELDGTAKASRE